MVIEDPDGYPIQLLSQDIDKHEQLEAACRTVVVEAQEQAIKTIKHDQNPITMEEAGLLPSPTCPVPSST